MAVRSRNEVQLPEASNFVGDVVPLLGTVTRERFSPLPPLKPGLFPAVTGREQRGSRGRLPAPLLGLCLCREIVLLSPGFFPHAHDRVGSFTPPFPSAAVGFHAVGTLPGVAPALTRAASLAGPSENVEETVTFLLGSLWKSVRVEMG